MHIPKKGPRGGPMVWFLAVLVIALSAKIHPITADIVVLAICLHAMRTDQNSRK